MSMIGFIKPNCDSNNWVHHIYIIIILEFTKLNHVNENPKFEFDELILNNKGFFFTFHKLVHQTKF